MFSVVVVGIYIFWTCDKQAVWDTLFVFSPLFRTRLNFSVFFSEFFFWLSKLSYLRGISKTIGFWFLNLFASVLFSVCYLLRTACDHEAAARGRRFFSVENLVFFYRQKFNFQHFSMFSIVFGHIIFSTLVISKWCGILFAFSPLVMTRLIFCVFPTIFLLFLIFKTFIFTEYLYYHLVLVSQSVSVNTQFSELLPYHAEEKIL